MVFLLYIFLLIAIALIAFVLPIYFFSKLLDLNALSRLSGRFVFLEIPTRTSTSNWVWILIFGSLVGMIILVYFLYQTLQQQKELKLKNKQLQEQLQFSEDSLKRVFDSSPNAIIMTDPEFRITAWNRAAELMYGYTSEESIGRPTMDRVRVQMSPDERDEQAQKLFSEGWWIGETKHLRRNGEMMDVASSVGVIYNEKGEANGVIAINKDISGRKENEFKISKLSEEREILVHQLMSQNAHLEEFAYIVSHNFRSSTSNLEMLIKMYKEEETLDGKRIFFEKIDEVTAHLSDTLNHLLQIVRIRNGEPVPSEVVEFEPLVKKIKDFLQVQIEETQVEIQSSFKGCETGFYPMVYIESIFTNLISNSIKYRDPSKSLKIQVIGHSDEEHLYIEFRDNGLGIDLERFGDKIFGLFRTFHRNKDAHGVGLFLTRAQVEAMGGIITVKSQPGVGTVFLVRLPLR